MADQPKSSEQTLYNTADGPRSIIDADGSTHVVPPGGSVTANFTDGEMDALHPDLSTDAPKADAQARAPAPGSTTEEADAQARAIEELATDLEKGNTRDALLQLAKAEDVAIETDDNKAQLALKIAQGRLGENK